MEIKNCIRHKLPKTREEWLANRLKGIGGSDAGSVLGFNDFDKPYKLWLEKTGRLVDDSDNETMRFGRDMENYVAQRFCEATGKKVYRSGYSYQSIEHPFMLANVDRLIVGENAGLECKHAGENVKTKYDKGDIPAQYYAQCMHYMAVTGAEKWYIAIYQQRKGLFWYEVQRDEDEIKALIEAEKDFWYLVENDIQPIIDGSTSTGEALNTIYANGNGESIDLTGKDEIIEELLKLKEQKKELEEQILKQENNLKEYLGENTMASNMRYSVTWKNYSTERVDTKLLQAQFPDVYSKVLKSTNSRRFSVKEL